jgi:hypothetical protein
MTKYRIEMRNLLQYAFLIRSRVLMEAMAVSALSARLEAPPCEVECRVQLGWRCESNRFQLDAGVKLIRIVTVGQHLGNVLQRRCICGINKRSKIGIGLSPGLSPDPKRGE